MATIAPTVMVALNRDATHEAALALCPPAKGAAPSEWLLLHALPVTASLSGALARVQAVLAAPTDLLAVRVGYVVSELHAYCLVCRCASPAAALALKETVEGSAGRGEAAPGAALAVEFLQPTATLMVTDGEPESAVLPLPDILACRLADTGRPPAATAAPAAQGGGLSALLQRPTAAASASPREDLCAICQVEPLSAAPCVMTLCQHTFHVHCYARLPSHAADCPLCRFSVYDLLNDARCEGCGTYEDLWVCLVCGAVNCGRGRRNHQQEHHRATGHSAVFQCSASRIYTYAARMFLHQAAAIRLGDAEGAREEQQPPPSVEATDWAAMAAEEEELAAALAESREEAVRDFYAGALAALMEEQRAYYEQRRGGRAAAGGGAPAEDTLAGVAAAESRARALVVNGYIEELRQLVSKLRMDIRAATRAARARAQELEDELDMQSAAYAAAKARGARVQDRLESLRRKGSEATKAKQRKMAELEKELEETLSSLGTS